MSSADFQTTAIGSLPHHNIDSALQFSFRTRIPFLPQIPIRNPWEYMLAQALEGIPGLQAESDGSVILHRDIWESRSATLTRSLNEAFARASSDAHAFQAFEPSAATSSSWQPFIWELEEREIKKAKVQIAGPLTAQWTLRSKDGEPLDRYPEISMQIYRLVLARALAMTRRLTTSGIAPILYIDEPGLYGLTPSNPKHGLGLRELSLMIQTLKKESVQVGVHCCSNTDWNAVLELGADILSLDTTLSLRNLFTPERLPKIQQYVASGGRFSLGVIPTGPTGPVARTSVLQSLEVETLFSELVAGLQASGASREWIHELLPRSIYTPACGLALHSVSDAERVLELLLEFRDYCISNLKRSL